FVVIFINDILVYSHTHKEHEEHLRAVLEVLNKKKLYAKLSKCGFWPEKVNFLVHVISIKGIVVNLAKVDERPRIVMEIRNFGGLTRYYKRFIKGLSKIVAPLIRKDQPFA
ncbi:hypothetical protein CR513_11006, partial [Mucuna pruriens]